LWIWQRIIGSTSSAFDCFLLNQGIKTLPLRMEKHCANALRLAQFLEGHKAVTRVFYLGLKSHPDYELAAR
jgi:cystathionine beta-lyase/cystathionine gamma-synthase